MQKKHLQHLFVIKKKKKILSKLEIEGNFLYLRKSIYKKKNPTANILNGEKIDAFLLFGKMVKLFFSPLLFNIILKVLGSTVR